MDDLTTIFAFIIILASVIIIIQYIITIINSNTTVNTTNIHMPNTNNQSIVEDFLDYQDVKTKTMNWCDKMQKSGLLTADQFDQCISSFQDTTAGIISSGIADNSKYGMGMDYSLYNTRSKQLSSYITDSSGGNNTNTIMLIAPAPVNNTIGCKPDGSLYPVPNIDDPIVNQKELYFTLQPINDTAFAILSPYGAFLVADNTYNASMTGKSIGPLSTWNIIKITDSSSSSSSSISQIMIESTQYPNFYLVIDATSNTLSIQQGQNDTMIWSIVEKASSDSSSDSTIAMNVSQYTVLKEDILSSFKNNAIIRAALQASIDTITKLQTQISNNYADITNYIQNYLQNQQQLYNLSSSDYNTRVQSIQNNSMIDPSTQQNLINNIPPIQGINLSSDTINQVLSAINNQKKITLQYINNNALIPLQQQLAALSVSDTALVDYNKFISDLQAALQDTNYQIIQNQKILARQKDNYNALNSDYSYQLSKISKLEKVDKLAELNVGLLSNYQSQKGYLNRIYPVCIFLLVVGFIYLTYLTYSKFISNVWSQYKD